MNKASKLILALAGVSLLAACGGLGKEVTREEAAAHAENTYSKKKVEDQGYTKVTVTTETVVNKAEGVLAIVAPKAEKTTVEQEVSAESIVSADVIRGIQLDGAEEGSTSFKFYINGDKLSWTVDGTVTLTDTIGGKAHAEATVNGLGLMEKTSYAVTASLEANGGGIAITGALDYVTTVTYSYSK